MKILDHCYSLKKCLEKISLKKNISFHSESNMLNMYFIDMINPTDFEILSLIRKQTL